MPGSWPQAWRKGWKADADTLACAPRYTVPKGSKHASNKEQEKTYLRNTKFTVGGGYRDTWVQAHVRRNRNPGPGHYKKNTELPLNKLSGTDYLLSAEGAQDAKNWRDEFNVNNTSKERAPRYTTLGRKEAREASFDKLRLSCLQPSYMNACIGKTTNVKATPGPGEYTQHTSFGAASGGSRKHYFNKPELARPASVA
jgi:hypothetical protein